MAVVESSDAISKKDAVMVEDLNTAIAGARTLKGALRAVVGPWGPVYLAGFAPLAPFVLPDQFLFFFLSPKKHPFYLQKVSGGDKAGVSGASQEEK